MEVTKVRSKLVKPIYHHGSKSVPCPSTDVPIPLCVFDTVTYNFYNIFLLAYGPSAAPPSSVIEKGLAVGLSRYREGAGRLVHSADGEPSIVLNDKGARLIEASANSPLDLDSILLRPASVSGLSQSVDDADAELVQVQLTRFTCGSLALVFSSHHRVMDGHSASNLFLEWGKASRRLTIGNEDGNDSPPALPVHDRVSFFAPRHPPLIEFQHRGVEYVKPTELLAFHKPPPGEEVVIHKAHFTREMLAELKAKASMGRKQQRPFTTFESLMGHLWRVITRARNLEDVEETSFFRVSVNGRRALGIPDDYFGNVVLWAYAKSKVKHLLDLPLQHAAAAIHKAVATVNSERYFRSFVDFVNSGVVEEEGLLPGTVAYGDELVVCPHVEAESWLTFQYTDMDFGTGVPYACVPMNSPVYEAQITVMRSPAAGTGGRGMDALLPVLGKDLAGLKEMCYMGLTSSRADHNSGVSSGGNSHLPPPMFPSQGSMRSTL